MLKSKAVLMSPPFHTALPLLPQLQLRASCTLPTFSALSPDTVEMVTPSRRCGLPNLLRQCRLCTYGTGPLGHALRLSAVRGW